MPDFTWKQGDTGPAVTDTLGFADGSIPPLTGDPTLTFRLRSMSSASLVTLTGVAEILSVSTGAVSFTPSAADTSQMQGNYIAEWALTTHGQTITFPTEGYLWGRIEANAATAPKLIVSVADLKGYLNINPSDHTRDFALARAIGVVTPLIEDYIGPVVIRQNDEWHDGGNNLIELWRQPSQGFGTNPVTELVAVSEYRGPIEYPCSLVPSPAFGSIYSAMLNPQMGTITRRTAGGATIAWMPGRESVHVIYTVGQNPVPANVEFAALEAARVVFTWGKQTGTASRSMADEQASAPNLSEQLRPFIRSLLAPDRRAPSFA